ncbi:MAG: penicillin-binding protein 2 [Patescibacteria group bacterium]
MYRLLASNQHELRQILTPERGDILVRDRIDNSLHALATNRDAWLLYVEPKHVDDMGAVAHALSTYSGKTEQDLLAAMQAHPDSLYLPIAKNLDTPTADQIQALNLQGVGVSKGWSRLYPEQDIGGHIIGFVRTDDSGNGKGAYGIEGNFDDILAGRPGFVTAQKDVNGRRLMLSGGDIRYATNGSNIILTIDRTMQYTVCQKLKAAVAQYQADGGTAIVMDPSTGAILSMCSAPDFDPSNFGSTKNISDFNNPVTFDPYEPGSIFKAITMSIGVEEGKVTPDTTYNDTGVVHVDNFDIHNSDKKGHGVQTMRQVLEKSLNTGTIFVEKLLGREAFMAGVQSFGFGTSTGIELKPEAAGNISSLKRKADVFGATASFGQGITATPIQLVTAYAAIANGGELMKPYIIQEIDHPDGTKEISKPQVVRRAISARTANLINGMLVSVVEGGHAANAFIPGYYVAGKTGTAQVPNPRGSGYLEGAIVSSFVGFAPADHPAFVLYVKLDRPKVGAWAESNASHLFHDIATYLLNYLDIPMERDPNAKHVPPDESQSSPDLAGGAPDAVSITPGTAPIVPPAGN